MVMRTCSLCNRQASQSQNENHNRRPHLVMSQSAPASPVCVEDCEAQSQECDIKIRG